MVEVDEAGEGCFLGRTIRFLMLLSSGGRLIHLVLGEGNFLKAKSCDEV